MKTIQPEFLFLRLRAASLKKTFFRKFLVLFISITTLHSVSRSQTGEMLSFDGFNDFVELGNLIPSGSYTKEAWINANSWGGSIGSIISGDNSAFWAPNGRLRAGHDINNIFNDVQAPVGDQMATGTWYHVAVTYDVGTNTLTLYQNGVQVDQGPASLTYAETNLFIAAFRAQTPPNDPKSVFDGSIDEVRIWNVARTQAEIQASMNCILTGDEPGLVAYYDFNQGEADGDNEFETVLLSRTDACGNGTIFNMNLGGVGGSNWSAPGAGVTGSCGGTFQDISVSGNSVCILDGKTAVSATDNTDFQGETVRTFTITNAGSATLNIEGVSFTGPDAANFVVTTPPASSLAPGASTTFQVNLQPSANASYSATVNIDNDDTDAESLFTFNIFTNFQTLPVNLLSFTVTKIGGHAKLDWKTATETNNDGFYVERSVDGRTWTAIAFIPGAGTTTTAQHYTFTDLNPAKGVNYYRLRQVDSDNRERYSEIRPVTFASELTLVYPVPTRDKVIIELPDTRMVGTRASIIDHNGRLLQQFTINKMQHEVSLSSYPSGVYVLRLEDGTSFRLVKQ